MSVEHVSHARLECMMHGFELRTTKQSLITFFCCLGLRRCRTASMSVCTCLCVCMYVCMDVCRYVGMLLGM